MVMVTAKTKKWGNSLGVVIPHEVVEELGLSPETEIDFLVLKKEDDLHKLFGSVPDLNVTQKTMDEIDEGWD